MRVAWSDVRYWKGSYDEDWAREIEQRRREGPPTEPDDREMWVFRVLVGVQVGAVILAVVMFVSSR